MMTLSENPFFIPRSIFTAQRGKHPFEKQMTRWVEEKFMRYGA